MPIEVRELVIRAVVEGNPPSQRESAAPIELQEQRQQLVSECVEQVLEILKNRQER